VKYHALSKKLEDTIELGRTIGSRLRGGEVIELVSDLGGGKTQFVRGLALGIGSRDQVQSPSFTVSRIYRGQNLNLYHYDFHRLDDPGLMRLELAEAIALPDVSVVVEWASSVHEVLPDDRLIVTITALDETKREIDIEATGHSHEHMLEGLK
jgi:tRNA threonylcarbamoyladenosine biosynthesis protein TsaE